MNKETVLIKDEVQQNGFSLVEILVAIMIFAIIALSLMALLPMGYRQVTDAGRRSLMSHLAHEKIDELKAYGYDNSNLLDGIHPTSGPYRLDQKDSDLKGYSLVWKVDDDDPNLPENIKVVILEVGYYLYKKNNDQFSSTEQPHQLRETFTTYIARQ